MTLPVWLVALLSLPTMLGSLFLIFVAYVYIDELYQDIKFKIYWRKKNGKIQPICTQKTREGSHEAVAVRDGKAD